MQIICSSFEVNAIVTNMYSNKTALLLCLYSSRAVRVLSRWLKVHGSRNTHTRIQQVFVQEVMAIKCMLCLSWHRDYYTWSHCDIDECWNNMLHGPKHLLAPTACWVFKLNLDTDGRRGIINFLDLFLKWHNGFNWTVIIINRRLTTQSMSQLTYTMM